MPETGEGVNRGERLAANAGAEKEAWAATLEDMRALAAELEDDGWSTVTIQAGSTAPTGQSDDDDRFGLVYVIPGNKAEPFAEAVESNDFPEYEVYRAEQSGKVFIVTEFRDPESKTAILIAGVFELRNSLGCVRAATETETMYTHIQKLDGTHLGSFRHDDYEKFFPSVTAVENWADVDSEAMNSD
ncbi:hypothetical protein E6P09_03380 [Haloferax mediterranei ATCC 33500]|uniref:Uncharacterized protein n=1 Tax=Haloferax mediterranei (strain ATCC 33500 / DSM 1411 / JCM 8866 / NBRC 14739 / NCIMB 2177 / R-4) TaxID=523841 RepID=I3R0P0_HALMT|nr:hypothetical protein [Haloferax mediterranei]AFK17800.1 hypothetical protein HFX_0057 [Haloferax mediterranei ATCC 33500]AHZ22772.1 hypothetical protein BM92_09005 [Haloferax mediterranei ATCC 33500]EMA02929.1 hypothetical protein C439_10110 [Haloferax mediterranei ATCC 33500]MDX5987889.1 hypothetical protein [Haloferax mediterranei ATCC 33500]QCQ74363.1 hypothetical protein E6P09_03380 [Haloferax mediterranei ATCC 33500]